MQKKFSIINFALLAAVLFSILFHSVHAIEHIAEDFASKKCHHSYDSSKTQITHQHHNFDECFACDFTFSNYIPCELFSYRLALLYKAIPYSLTAPDVKLVFSGNSNLLRGPPVIIV